MKKQKHTLSSFVEWMTVIKEEYVSGVIGRGEEYQEIFKNPNASEIRDLKKGGAFVRFIAMGKDIYVFPQSLLHAEAITHLKLPISHTPAAKKAFLGVAKIIGPMNMEIRDMMTMSDEDVDNLEVYHPILLKYFPS